MQDFVAVLKLRSALQQSEIGNCICLSKRQKINAKVQIALQGCFAWMSVPTSCLEMEGMKIL